MKAGELITSVTLPKFEFGDNHTYLKIRDRLSYAFALVSVAAAIKVQDGAIADIRVSLGGVAHKPWRDHDAESRIKGQRADAATFNGFAEDVLRDARGQGANDFKIGLARRVIVRALEQAAAGKPQDQADKSVH